MMMMMIMHVTLTGSVLVIVAEVCVNSATELQDIVPLVLVHDFILRLLWNTYMGKKNSLKQLLTNNQTFKQHIKFSFITTCFCKSLWIKVFAKCKAK